MTFLNLEIQTDELVKDRSWTWKFQNPVKPLLEKEA